MVEIEIGIEIDIDMQRFDSNRITLDSDSGWTLNKIESLNFNFNNIDYCDIQ